MQAAKWADGQARADPEIAADTGEGKNLQILLSYSQAGPGRKAMQDKEEEISRNHAQRLFVGSVENPPDKIPGTGRTFFLPAMRAPAPPLPRTTIRHLSVTRFTTAVLRSKRK